jgi:hypothetical protein
MMTDGYAEQIVKGRTTPQTILCIVLGFLLAFAGLGLTVIIGAIGLVILIIGIVLVVVFIPRRETEYEYIMVNDDIEISRITAKKSRKKLYQFVNGDVKQVMETKSIYRDNEHQADRNIRVYDFTSPGSEKKDNLYSFFINKKSGTEEVVLELSEKTLEHVNMFFKSKIRK